MSCSFVSRNSKIFEFLQQIENGLKKIQKLEKQLRDLIDSESDIPIIFIKTHKFFKKSGVELNKFWLSQSILWFGLDVTGIWYLSNAHHIFPDKDPDKETLKLFWISRVGIQIRLLWYWMMQNLGMFIKPVFHLLGSTELVHGPKIPKNNTHKKTFELLSTTIFHNEKKKQLISIIFIVLVAIIFGIWLQSGFLFLCREIWNTPNLFRHFLHHLGPCSHCLQHNLIKMIEYKIILKNDTKLYAFLRALV